jgi:coenzyme F420-reducing hydrogenase alpha subunit
MERITKVEGDASLSLSVKEDKVTAVNFKIAEYKRFYTEALKGKAVLGVPQLLARICGTCSNAHILASIAACESALGVTPSEQTKLLRTLTAHGLMIRDHALHLYLFSMPDIYGKDAFLDFDENNPDEHQLLHDGFEVKSAGNFLATLVAGRSVHAIYPVIGGFLHFPEKEGIAEAVQKLEAARPAVVRLIKIFKEAPFRFDRKTTYMALVPDTSYGYLAFQNFSEKNSGGQGGKIMTSKGEVFGEDKFREHLERVIIPYSQAVGYTYKGESYLVGALARMNLAKDKLHPNARESAKEALALFPSTDIFCNNLAQAIEILHSIDEAVEILKSKNFSPEPAVKGSYRDAVGVGVVEAPRGTLYHKITLGADGIVKEGEVIVPTGQNQINIEQDIGRLVQGLLPDTPKEKIEFEIEKLIRAYDPCMSCAAHFLKVEWNKSDENVRNPAE